ncbi:MAG: LysR family transcriptional regulator [Burkholderiales bacterium]|nr:LysR family transcriptional regulator [Burkholderiales bacterium]
MNINLKQLRAFVAVYRTRHFGTASETLFLTHSAVSVLIRQLETTLGQKLFDRTTRIMRPTAAADDLLPIAERVLRDLGSIDEHFRHFASGTHGKVCLAVTATVAAGFAPKVVGAFVRANPGVQVQIEDCAPDQFLPRVLSERVEFGLGVPELVTSDIDTEVLIKDYLCAVLPVDHPLARAGRLRWAELREHPVIAVKPGYGIRPLIDQVQGKTGVKLRFAYEVAFLSTVFGLASEGLGIAIMPQSLANPTNDPRLTVRKLIAPVVMRNICIVIKRDATLSPVAQNFLKYVRNFTKP